MSTLHVTLELPPELHEVPVPADPSHDDAVAEQLVAALYPGVGGGREELLERYRTAVGTLRAAGTLVAAVSSTPVDGQVSGSLLTVDVRPLAGDDDPQVAAEGLLAVQRLRVPPPVEVAHLDLPLGPAVLAVHSRTWVLDELRVPYSLVELFLPVPPHAVLVVLALHCPVPAHVEHHAALAGSVAASIRLAPVEVPA